MDFAPTNFVPVRVTGLTNVVPFWVGFCGAVLAGIFIFWMRTPPRGFTFIGMPTCTLL